MGASQLAFSISTVALTRYFHSTQQFLQTLTQSLLANQIMDHITTLIFITLLINIWRLLFLTTVNLNDVMLECRQCCYESSQRS